MTVTTGGPTRTIALVRRRWRVLVLLSGLTFLTLTVLLARYLDGRIVLLGPIDGAKVEALLGVIAVWCFAASLIGSLVKVAHGRFTVLFIHGIVVPAVGLGAFALSAIVGVLLSVRLGVDPLYELAVPESSPKYIVSTFTFGETSLTLYRGNGIVYQRVRLQLPDADHSASFASTHRVETNGDGQSFLIYRQADGKYVRVPLPPY